MYANYPPGEYLWWNWLDGAHYPSLKSSLLIIFAIAMLRDEVHMLAKLMMLKWIIIMLCGWMEGTLTCEILFDILLT